MGIPVKFLVQHLRRHRPPDKVTIVVWVNLEPTADGRAAATLIAEVVPTRNISAYLSHRLDLPLGRPPSRSIAGHAAAEELPLPPGEREVIVR